MITRFARSATRCCASSTTRTRSSTFAPHRSTRAIWSRCPATRTRARSAEATSRARSRSRGRGPSGRTARSSPRTSSASCTRPTASSAVNRLSPTVGWVDTQAHTWFALHELLGERDVKNYDGWFLGRVGKRGRRAYRERPSRLTPTVGSPPVSGKVPETGVVRLGGQKSYSCSGARLTRRAARGSCAGKDGQPAHKHRQAWVGILAGSALAKTVEDSGLPSLAGAGRMPPERSASHASRWAHQVASVDAGTLSHTVDELGGVNVFAVR